MFMMQKSPRSSLGLVGLVLMVQLAPTACGGGEPSDADAAGGEAGAPATGGRGSGGDGGDGTGAAGSDAGGSSGGASDGGTGGNENTGGNGGEGGFGGDTASECEDDAERTVQCASGAADAEQEQVCVDGVWHDDGACTCALPAEEYDPIAARCFDPIPCDASGVPFGGGEGTEQSPFVICSTDQLTALASALDAHFVLARSLDLAAADDFLPIGSAADPFVGVFDGAGRTLHGLSIEEPTLDDIGLFGVLGDTGAPATVRDLELRSFVIEGEETVGALAGRFNETAGLVEGVTVAGGEITAQIVVGGLVGWAEGTVRGCASSAEVAGLGGQSEYFGTQTGGLVGFSSGLLEDCSATGDVSGAAHTVGGLVGFTQSSAVVRSSRTSGDVAGTNLLGGLIGYCQGSLVEDTGATGQITGTSNVGGLVGYVEGGSVVRSFAEGAVVASGSHAGGLIGQLAATGSPVSDCYATGDVSADDNVGGLVGNAQSTPAVTNCYAWGVVSGDTSGGLIGLFASATATACYFPDSEPDNGRGTPLPVAEFANQATFAGWDFVDTWRMSQDLGRPVLAWEP